MRGLILFAALLSGCTLYAPVREYTLYLRD